uniref:Uncharacterized protein n=1 Tax=Anguilla anguilla TaxID=7936 RepID=A0A0E9QDN6_ANGAN
MYYFSHAQFITMFCLIKGKNHACWFFLKLQAFVCCCYSCACHFDCFPLLHYLTVLILYSMTTLP